MATLATWGPHAGTTGRVSLIQTRRDKIPRLTSSNNSEVQSSEGQTTSTYILSIFLSMFPSMGVSCLHLYSEEGTKDSAEAFEQSVERQ